MNNGDEQWFCIRTCSYGPGRWDGPLRQDPAERLLSIQKHCSVHMRRRAGPLGDIPVQGYRDPSYWARQIGAAPAHCPIWTAHPTYRDEKLATAHAETSLLTKINVFTWLRDKTQPSGQDKIFPCERAKKFVPTGGLSHLHMNRALDHSAWHDYLPNETKHSLFFFISVEFSVFTNFYNFLQNF